MRFRPKYIHSNYCENNKTRNESKRRKGILQRTYNFTHVCYFFLFLDFFCFFLLFFEEVSFTTEATTLSLTGAAARFASALTLYSLYFLLINSLTDAYRICLTTTGVNELLTSPQNGHRFHFLSLFTPHLEPLTFTSLSQLGQNTKPGCNITPHF